MARRKNTDNELQLEFNFRNDDSAVDMSRQVVHTPVARHIKELPILTEEDERLDFFCQVDILLQQIGDCRMIGDSKLNTFILRSFYVEGKSVNEIAQLLSDGVEGVPCVTRERVRMIVAEFRDELLSMPPSKKLTKGIVMRSKFVEKMKEYSVSHLAQVVKESKWLASPRLGAIAFLIRKKIVTGDTVIPWIKTEKILISENIDKRMFNAHYAALFYLLQKEVRPMTFEDIMRGFSQQKQMKGVDVCEELLCVLLQHDEVFDEIMDNHFQLRDEHLNVTQRVARIIFEEKDVTPSELKRIYAERYGESFSSLATAGKIYPWCVPVGKSKWVYREDGERLRMPADIIREFCKERVRFTLKDMLGHLEAEGVNIKESSVRCYILRDCRPLNADGNTFCLTSHVAETENHLWRSKSATSTHSHKKEWKNKMEVEIRNILEHAPMQKMLQKEILNQCRFILEQEGISYNNFYKIASTLPWLKSTSIEGKTYLELTLTNS